MSRSHRIGTGTRWLLASTVTALLAGACGVPVPPAATTDGDDGIAPTTARELLDPTDVGSEVLGTQLTVLAERVAAIQAHLRDAEALLAAPVAQGGSAVEQLRAAAELGDLALELLLGDGSREGTPDPDAGRVEGAPGLLPSIDPDRAGRGSDDLITATVTLAGDVGGERARTVLELVRDPMVGDLGVWQRDPLGVIALLRETARTATDPAALDRDLLAYSGLLTRTLAYILVLTTTSDPTLARHAAGTGAAHLAVVGFAIEDTRTQVAG